jgi:hypothetical protein
MGTPSPRPPGQRSRPRCTRAAVAAEDQQRVHAAAGKRAVQRVAGLEGQRRRVQLVALERTHPALEADHHGHRLVDHLHLGHRRLLFLDQRAALVAVGLGVGFDLLDHRALERRRAGQDLFELACSVRSSFSSCSILMASSRASWRSRMSRMSSAWRSLSA